MEYVENMNNLKLDYSKMINISVPANKKDLILDQLN